MACSAAYDDIAVCSETEEHNLQALACAGFSTGAAEIWARSSAPPRPIAALVEVADVRGRSAHAQRETRWPPRTLEEMA